MDHYADRPNAIDDVRRAGGLTAGEPAAVRAAVTYVAGMTDRYAFRQAVAELGWDPAKLPKGIDGWTAGPGSTQVVGPAVLDHRHRPAAPAHHAAGRSGSGGWTRPPHSWHR